jgi:hypothetical protein
VYDVQSGYVSGPPLGDETAMAMFSGGFVTEQAGRRETGQDITPHGFGLALGQQRCEISFKA